MKALTVEVIPLSQEFLKTRIVPIDIEGIDTISGILAAFNNTSFQSRNLARCVEIFTKMLEDPDDPTIFLGLAGAMIPAGMKKVISTMVKRKMIPKEFFVTSGKAISPVSELNAFDLALKNAGIAQCNLVPVSSILPSNCMERKWKKLPIGSITFAVMARMDGDEGTLIGAGIAWAWKKDKKYGLVAEAHGYMDQKALKEILEWKIREMAKVREIEINDVNCRFENLRVPMDNYGCVVAAVIYIL